MGEKIGDAFIKTTRGSAVLVASLIFAFFTLADSDSGEVMLVLIVASMVAYLVVLMRFASRTPERKQFLSNLVLFSVFSYGMWTFYTVSVGGWFWNDDWHVEVAMLFGMLPPLLFLSRAMYSISAQMVNPRTDGCIASLPFCVASPMIGVPALALIGVLLMLESLFAPRPT